MPVLHAIRDTGRYLKDRGVKTVGIMATDGTVTSGLFQKELLQFGIQPIAPEKEKQSYVMQIIYDQVKTGKPVHVGGGSRLSSNPGCRSMPFGMYRAVTIKERQYPSCRIPGRHGNPGNESSPRVRCVSQGI